MRIPKDITIDFDDVINQIEDEDLIFTMSERRLFEAENLKKMFSKEELVEAIIEHVSIIEGQKIKDFFEKL